VLGLDIPHLGSCCESVFAGHVDVEEDEIGAIREELLDCIHAVDCFRVVTSLRIISLVMDEEGALAVRFSIVVNILRFTALSSTTNTTSRQQDYREILEDCSPLSGSSCVVS